MRDVWERRPRRESRRDGPPTTVEFRFSRTRGSHPTLPCKKIGPPFGGPDFLAGGEGLIRSFAAHPSGVLASLVRPNRRRRFSRTRGSHPTLPCKKIGPPFGGPDFLAGGEGFEPPLAESESAVLPLDDPPKSARGLHRRHDVYRRLTFSVPPEGCVPPILS